MQEAGCVDMIVYTWVRARMALSKAKNKIDRYDGTTYTSAFALDRAEPSGFLLR